MVPPDRIECLLALQPAGGFSACPVPRSAILQAGHSNSGTLVTTDQQRTPVILMGVSSVPGAAIFNGNDWEGRGRLIVRSCGSEYAMLLHAVSQVQQISSQAVGYCGPQIDTLR